jgi:hypothetical protein
MCVGAVMLGGSAMQQRSGRDERSDDAFVNVRVSKVMLEAVRNAAEEEDRTISSYIRHVIRCSLGEQLAKKRHKGGREV